MPSNEFRQDVLPTGGDVTRDVTPRASLAARITARLLAGKFDRLIAVGVPAQPGSALAVHYYRLTSVAEREAIARSLRQVVTDARAGGTPMSSRIPLHLSNVTAAEDLIDQITLRLHSPRPVGARGMARLRQLLADGAGPLYRFGRGDLNGRLGAALAEL
ncbi:MAG TPA: hypothetical protein VHI10_05705 [Mycobacterium sp.]|nr:hypothetical protein [Mycobacterium sp.]